MARSIVQLTRIDTNAHSTGNKQEELEATVQLTNYDIVATTETQWDDPHNCSATVDGYKLFRRGRQGGRGGGVALCVWESFDRLELDSPVGCRSHMVFPRAWYWGRFSLISLSVIWTLDGVHPQ